MSILISIISRRELVRFGCLAGQYAKSRSADKGDVYGLTQPVYRGDMVNPIRPTQPARTPDPLRVVESHFRAWLGDRTQKFDGANVADATTVHNPIGLKVGPTLEPDALLRPIDRRIPHKEEGKVLLITRFGSRRATYHLMALHQGGAPRRAAHGSELQSDARQHLPLPERLHDERPRISSARSCG